MPDPVLGTSKYKADWRITSELRECVMQFSMSEGVTEAVILKCNVEEGIFEVVEHLKECSLDEVKQKLPQNEPLFILFAYALTFMERTKDVKCLICYDPPGTSHELRPRYIDGSRRLANWCQITMRVTIAGDISKFTQEFIDAQFTHRLNIFGQKMPLRARLLCFASHKNFGDARKEQLCGVSQSENNNKE